MVDIHCHILPGVDDGAESMEDALLMARMAADSGVTDIIATPHCNLPYEERKNYASPELERRFVQLQKLIQLEDIPITIHPGAEVLCTPDVPELLQKGALRHLAQTNYLLVEFFFDEPLSYMSEMLDAIAEEGVVPVIAHPERYKAVQRMPQVVENWFYSGVVVQLNKGSILGQLGRNAERAADWILSRGLAHVVASDGHSPLIRTPQMDEVARRLDHLVDPEYAEILLEYNPARLLAGKSVLQAE